MTQLQNCLIGVKQHSLTQPPTLGRVKPDYEIGISAKHPALRRKRKDWLARNQNNVSEWSDMSTRGL